MNWTQFGQLLHDYGPIVFIIALIVVVLAALVAAWKPISTFVLAVNTIIELPVRLDKQDTAVSEVDTKLSEHVREYSDGKGVMDELQREVKALGQQQLDIIHEVKPNHGTSMKDAVVRAEQHADEARALAEQNFHTISGISLSLDLLLRGQSGLAESNVRRDARDARADREAKQRVKPSPKMKADSTEDPEEDA